MPRFGLVGPSYASQSSNADAQATINWYNEQIESGAGNAPLVLYPTPGTQVFVNLGRTITPGANGIGPLDGAPVSGTGTSTAVSTSTATPSTPSDMALMIVASGAATFTPTGGWAVYSGNTFAQEVTAPVAGSGTLNFSTNWTALVALFKSIGGTLPPLVQEQGVSGSLGSPGHMVLTTVVPGDTILVALSVGGNGGVPTGITVGPDSAGNIYTKIGSALGATTEVGLWQTIATAGGNLTIPYTGSAGPSTDASIIAMEITTGTTAVTNAGPTRGELTITGRTFVVCGTDFDEIFANGTFTTWGEVANDSLPVTMAASPQQLLLASAGTAYVFDLTANTLTPIPGATFSGPVSQAAICDDFFILTIKNTKEFYVSGVLDATDWVTNGAAIVSVFPDNIVSMIVDHRQIWFFSDTKSVVYYDSGNIFPFDVIPGSYMEAGCAAEFSPQLFPNGVTWLGSDERGTGVVWLGPPGGGTPNRISNHALEFAIQGYTRIDDAVAITYQDQGHLFYQIYFPTPSVTWTYDVNTQMWHQRGYFVEAIGNFQAVHYWNHTFNFGKHLVGDWQSGNVYQLHIPVYAGGAWTFATDAGNPVVRVRRAPHISSEQKRQFHAELQVYVETGIGPMPPITGLANGPSEVIFQSPDLSYWSVSITDSGSIVVASIVTVGTPETVILNYLPNPANSFQIGVSDAGGLTVTEIPLGVYPTSFPMTTTGTGLQSGLVIT